MTYRIRVVFRSGAVIAGTCDEPPQVTKNEQLGNLFRMRSTEWKDSRHISVENWDTIVNMDDVTMIQFKEVTF